MFSTAQAVLLTVVDTTGRHYLQDAVKSMGRLARRLLNVTDRQPALQTAVRSTGWAACRVLSMLQADAKNCSQ